MESLMSLLDDHKESLPDGVYKILAEAFVATRQSEKVDLTIWYAIPRYVTDVSKFDGDDEKYNVGITYNLGIEKCKCCVERVELDEIKYGRMPKLPNLDSFINIDLGEVCDLNIMNKTTLMKCIETQSGVLVYDRLA